MKNNNQLFYGISASALAVVCLTWLKEDSFSLLGMFTMQCKTLGIILAVIGGWNLLASDDFWKLVGEIVAIIAWAAGWLVEHWYLVVLVIALFGWMKPEEKVSAEENTGISAATEQTLWAGDATETVPAVTKPAVEYVHQLYPGMRKDAGYCRNLRSDAMMLVVFVNDSESNWTQQEIQNFLSNLVAPGLEFITYRASEYGWGITMESCVYSEENGDTKVMAYNGTLPERSTTGSVVPELTRCAAETYGFATVEDMIENVRNYAGTDQVGLLFCLDKAGRSYAHSHDKVKDYAEGAVIYTSWQGYESRPSVVAHETMHLFGAEDMYAEGQSHANRAVLAGQWHPTELFYQSQWNLYDNVISPYTAYAVGWTDSLPAQYDCAAWWS